MTRIGAEQEPEPEGGLADSTRHDALTSDPPTPASQPPASLILEAPAPDSLPPDALIPDALGAPSLEAACEALLLLADQPLDLLTLASVVRRPVAEVEAVVHGLSEQYTADCRGFDLRRVGGGWRFYTREDCTDVVTRFVVDGQQARLTQAALETLAIIAYRQPISRGRISAIRGVNVDGVVRTLISRGLVSEAGTEQGSQATLLGTTPYFLERLGVSDLSALPPLADHVPTYHDLGDLADVP